MCAQRTPSHPPGPHPTHPTSTHERARSTMLHTCAMCTPLRAQAATIRRGARACRPGFLELEPGWAARPPLHCPVRSAGGACIVGNAGGRPAAVLLCPSSARRSPGRGQSGLRGPRDAGARRCGPGDWACGNRPLRELGGTHFGTRTWSRFSQTTPCDVTGYAFWYANLVEIFTDNSLRRNWGLDSATNLEYVERPPDSAERGIGAHSSRIQRALGGLHSATRPPHGWD